MTLYIKTTDDEYELPVAVGDSVIELARILKLNKKSLESIFSKIRKGKYGNSIYKIVEVDDEER